MSNRSRRSALLLWSALAGFALFGYGPAAEAGDQAYQFDIPAESLGQALTDFSRTSSQQIVFSEDVTAGKSTKGLHGRYTVARALDLLLAGTGLRVAVDPSGVLMVQSKNAQASSSEEALEEVVVTGSRLKQSSAEAGLELRTYTQEQIEQSGQSTVSGFLNTLPEVSTAVTELGSIGVGDGAQTTVQLRGLPVGATLVLLNGRRVETGGNTQFFDLNTIPPAAISRIEIIPEGSSAIYGSDALAGVVNIILKQDFNGLAANVHYGAADGTNEASADMTWGRSWSRGSVTLVGSYQGRSELDASERAITANQNFTAFGGPDSRAPYRCNPGTVYSANGADLTGLNSPQAAIPPGIHGTPAISDFAGTAGQQNLCSANEVLLPESRRGSFMATGTYDVTASQRLFAEVLYSRVAQYNNAASALLLPSFSTTLPASNPFNPFGENVRIDEEISLPPTTPFATTFIRALIGARGALSEKWDWELAAWDAQDREATENPAVNPVGLLTALNSTDPATALNPFAPVPPAQLSTLAAYNSLVYRGRTLAANGFVRGALFQLPSGAVNVVLGGEYVRDELGFDPISVVTFSNVRTDYRRSESSVFGELHVPLIGNRLNPAAGDRLAVNAAARHDAYQGFGGKTVPQFSVEWRPSRALLLRGTYAEAYRAPSLSELHSFDVPVLIPSFPIQDPQRGGATELATLILQNHPLEPESGQSRSAGLVWSPEQLEGLKVSGTWWAITQTNRIAELNSQDIVDNAALFPGLVVRGPPQVNGGPGSIVSVSSGFLNFGRLDVRGIDIDLTYRYQTAIGQFQPSASFTDIYRYLATVTPGAPIANRLEKANLDAFAPRWKGTVALNWRLGSYSANIDGRYVGKYSDYSPLTSGPNAGTTQILGNFWLADLNLRYDFDETGSRGFKFGSGAYVSVGAVNVFNSLPPFSMFDFAIFGFDPAEYDIRGRFVYANVGVRF